MTAFLQLVVSGLLIGALYSIAACSIVLVFKATRIISIAHGLIMALGAFFLWFVLDGLAYPLWLSFILCVVFLGLVGFLLERIALRPLIGQPMFIVFFMTFGLYLVLEGFYNTLLGGVPRGFTGLLPSQHFYLGDVAVYSGSLIIMGVVLLVFLLLGLFFRYTSVGLRMRAVSEDHELAQATGISVRRIFALVWIVSAIIAGLAGIATASVVGISVVLPMFLIIRALIAAIVGGLDSIPGALVGGLILGVAESIGAGYLDPIVGGGFKEVAAVFVLLIVLMIRPYGIFGQAEIERV